MVSVRVENLLKRFGLQTAVDHVSFKVDDGRFTCLLGPSGCGKTTTLRIISGLEFQDEGSVYFDEKPVNELPPAERNVSMVFQFYAMYPNMSVFDEIAFPLKMTKRPQQEIREKVKKVSEIVGLSASLHDRASRLTVDQKQRVELARAIIKEPSVFLFDEPLTNLDANLRVEMRAEIARIQKELSITTIYVTHDQTEAMALGDKIAVMNFGKIEQYDTTSTVYENPLNRFVAGFIGTPPMNFLDCVVRVRGEGMFLEADGLSIPAAEGMRVLLKAHQDEDVVLGVRPEYIETAVARGMGVATAKVDVVEPLGHRLILNVRVGNAQLKVNSRYIEVSPNEDLLIRIPPQRTRIFDSTTGSVIA